MTCTKCGQPIAAGVRFCGNCGAPVVTGARAASRGSNRAAWLIGTAIASALGVVAVLWVTGGLPGGDNDAPPVATEAFTAATADLPTAVPAEPTAEPSPEPTEADIEAATEAATEAPTVPPAAAPATAVPQPTAPPVPTATAVPTVAPLSIEFFPDNGQFVIPKGQLCTALNWRTTGVTDLYLQREGGDRTEVGPTGRQGDICFSEEEMTYFLHYRLPDGREESRSVRFERE